MGFRKQVEVSCDLCRQSIVYTRQDGWNLNRVARLVRERGWRVGKLGVFCDKCRHLASQKKANHAE